MNKILNNTIAIDGAIIDYTSQMEVVNCHNCGGTYALSARFLKTCRDAGQDKSWNCPYCKKGTVFGKSQADQLREQLNSQRQQTQYQREEKERYLQQRDAANRSTYALRGVVTKKKQQLARVQNGVCPCCNRHFKNLERHMENKHSGSEIL